MAAITPTKRLKFSPELVSKILSREKTSTWRVDDDKDLRMGDIVACMDASTGETFAMVQLTEVFSKPFHDLLTEDHAGHETYASDEERYAWFSAQYRKPVGPNTIVKVARFVLLPSS